MRVEVTAEDIANGKQNHCERCPIALALSRAGAVAPSVFPVNAYWAQTQGGYRSRHRLPGVARTFIAAFDEAGHVEPFAFDIED